MWVDMVFPFNDLNNGVKNANVNRMGAVLDAIQKRTGRELAGRIRALIVSLSEEEAGKRLLDALRADLAAVAELEGAVFASAAHYDRPPWD